MLQYVSDILKNFSQGQRIFVLVLILFSLVTITIGPGIADSFFPGRENLVKSVNEQRTQISGLENEVRNLKYILSQEADSCEIRIRQGSISCTDAIIKREKQILEALAILKRNMEAEIEIDRSLALENYIVSGDTVSTESAYIRNSSAGESEHYSLDHISTIMGEIKGHIGDLESQKTPD